MFLKTYDDLRKAMPKGLPFSIKEVLIGNVVVGNYNLFGALQLSQAIYKHLNHQYSFNF